MYMYKDHLKNTIQQYNTRKWNISSFIYNEFKILLELQLHMYRSRKWYLH